MIAIFNVFILVELLVQMSNAIIHTLPGLRSAVEIIWELTNLKSDSKILTLSLHGASLTPPLLNWRVSISQIELRGGG